MVDEVHIVAATISSKSSREWDRARFARTVGWMPAAG
jgi:hypothetical protein